MDCLSPINVQLTEKASVHHHGYQYVKVPCGKCEACIKRKQSQWFVRLKMESETSDYVHFVTLTYDDEHLPANLSVSKYDVQCYHKRLREALGSRSKDFKYFLTSEYGPETHRPHYHAIYYGISPDDLHHIESSWQNGFVTFDQVTDGRLRYVTGYIIEKLFVPTGRKPLFNLISKGLGASYIERYRAWHSDAPIGARSYIPYHGHKYPMPRYYKERLYSAGQRSAYASILSQKADERDRERKELYGVAECIRKDISARYQFCQQVRKAHKKKKVL